LSDGDDHAQMEPTTCTVWVRADGAEVWAGTQWPTKARDEAAKLLGVAPERVVLHQVQIGGGFGPVPVT
jgi:isoquinoline 1-oxidoreductase subunit beta